MSRAPITLSREMRLALIALLMLGLLGGWLLYNNNRAAQDTAAVTPPAPQTGTNSGQGSAGTGGQSEQSSTAQGTSGNEGSVSGTPNPSATDPSATVPSANGGAGRDSVTAPPFPVTDPNGSTPDPTVPPPKPSGINPDTPLLGLNGHNPFRPIRLDEKTTANAGPITQTPTASSTPNTPSVTITPPRSSTGQINDALATSSGSTGAIPVSPIPTTPTTSAGRNTTPSTTQTGAIPVTPIPTTTIPTPSSVAQVPGNTIKVPSGQPSGQNASSTQTGATKPSAPPRPPVVGMNVPSVNVNTNPGSPPAGNAGGNANNSGGNNLPQPTTPDLITDTDSAATGTVTTLDRFVQERGLIFDAAVLGPVNTAVLRTGEGFLVATSGQTLPNSNVSVKEITATSITLAQGNVTKTLQLDKR